MERLGRTLDWDWDESLVRRLQLQAGEAEGVIAVAEQMAPKPVYDGQRVGGRAKLEENAEGRRAWPAAL